MEPDESKHNQRIFDQFSKQAAPFSRMPAHMDSLQLLMSAVSLQAGDSVLDVACGPGLLGCEFARVAAKVTGIDLTPAMIEAARQRQIQAGLQNMAWHVGSAMRLPFADNTFDVVVTRYSFHHLLRPADALSEMIRVCRRSGRVLIADVVVDKKNQPAYDQMEQSRDSSHTHALTTDDWDGLLMESGLGSWKRWQYGVDVEVESLLSASFPDSDGAANFRRMVSEDIGSNRIGINARLVGPLIWFTFPIGVFAAHLPAFS